MRIERRTGTKINPWRSPKVVQRNRALKKTLKTYDWEAPRKRTASHVEKPPEKTAAPMVDSEVTSRSFPVPALIIKACAVCTE